MSIFKFLIYSLVATGSLPANEENGWFTVEKMPNKQEQSEEDDPTIWVLFTKNLGSESLMVRFPQEPLYRYTEAGEFEVVSDGEGETFQLTVQEKGGESLLTPEIHYQSEGKWVHEYFLKTEDHLYHLKTTSNLADSKNHREFFSSLSIEKNG